MKHLIWLALLLPFYATAQVNGSIQKTTATGTVRYYNATAGTDTLLNKVRINSVVSGNLLQWNGVAWVNVAASTVSGVTGLAAFGSTPNANGASISGNTITLQPASASFPGGVTTGTQTFVGAKTFATDVTMSGATVQTLSNGLVGSSGGVLLQAVANTDFLPVSSPAMTGTPTAPTATAGTSTGQIATTSFVTTAVGSGGVWTRTGTTLSPTTANDIASITSNTTGTGLAVTVTGSIGTAISGTSSTGNAISGYTTGPGYSGGAFGATGTNAYGVRGTATDGKGGDFYNNSATYATLYTNNVGGGNLAEFANGGGVVTTITNSGGLITSGNSGQGITPNMSDFNASTRVYHIYQNTTNGAGFKAESSNASMVMVAGNNTGFLYMTGSDPMQIGTNNTAGITLSATQAVRFNTYGAGTLTTDASGNITATSDRNAKENFTPYTKGLDALREWKPQTYNWRKETGLDTVNRYTSLIAQDVQKTAPEGVFPAKEGGYLGVQDRVVQATMVNAINELNDMVTKQQALITALEARIKVLELKP